MLNVQRASEGEFNLESPTMQSTPLIEAGKDFAEDLWAAWPYCWAIDLHDFARASFHSFHEKHNEWKLARFNRCAQQKFRAQFWQSWQRESDEEVLELKLV
jgi:hypothetical protein